jgi:hypothetical protein
MNMALPRKNFFGRAWILAALFAGFFLIPAARAQPADHATPGRFLFIFDTASAMKNRTDAMDKALKIMLATSLNGRLHSGDSIGVWTFSQDLASGNYPLQTWQPENAVTIASNLVKFVDGQHYAKTARFEALQPLLNQVVQGSERLTVLIFCDGSVKMTGTPFDAGINDAFQQKLAEQGKARQPFIIALRSQLGQFTGGTVSFPPGALNIPEFPPLPLPPPPPAPKVMNPPPPPPVTNVVPSLIIIGTNVSSSLPPPETNSPPPTNTPPPVVPPPAVIIQPTNASAMPTNPAVTTIVASPPTNSPASPTENSGASGEKLLVGASLLGAVVLSGIFVWLRSHRKDTSLITRSMNDRR